MKKLFSLLILVFGLFLVTGCGNHRMNDSEAVAWTSLRLAIAQSDLDGTGNLTPARFNALGNMAQSLNRNNEWFDIGTGPFYAETRDTSNRQIVFISNGIHVARFEVEFTTDGGGRHTLVEYSFTEGERVGNMISIREE